MDPSKVVLDLRWTQGSHVAPKERSRRWLPRGKLVVDADSFRAALDERRYFSNRRETKGVELVVQVIGGPDAGRSVRGTSKALILEHLHPALAVVEVRTAAGETVSRRTTLIGDLRPTEMEASENGSRAQLEIVDWAGDPLDDLAWAQLQVRGDGRGPDWGSAPGELPRELESPFLLEVRGKGIARATSTESISSEVVGPIRLEQAAELDVQLHAPEHEGKPATVWVQNAGDDFAPRAHRTQLEATVGETPVSFEELSPGDAWILAIAHRPYPAVGLVRRHLVGGIRDSVVVPLTPTRMLEGRVHARGAPAAGMKVELWCSRPLDVSSAFLGRPRDAYQYEVLPLYPPAFQSVTTDAEGRFTFADWPELDDEHWLEVLRPEGRREKAEEEASPLLAMLGYTAASSPTSDPVIYALRVPENRGVFDIDLAGPPPNVPKGALRLRLRGVDAEATVHVRCDGQAESDHELEGNTLLFGPLARGTWTATVTVGGVVWLEPTEINLQGVFDLEVAAPGGAGG
ncbi:MAG: hypothetical protein GC161_13915 [Planctomycetaceae bacterium]|nr:hypothetical protein [Planctomycetaceae bacterium]